MADFCPGDNARAGNGPGAGHRHAASGSTKGVRAARRGRLQARRNRRATGDHDWRQQGAVAPGTDASAKGTGAITMTITCEHVDTVLSAWFEGDLEPAERHAVDAHLRECLRCASI